MNEQQRFHPRTSIWRNGIRLIVQIWCHQTNSSGTLIKPYHEVQSLPSRHKLGSSMGQISVSGKGWQLIRRCCRAARRAYWLASWLFPSTTLSTASLGELWTSVKKEKPIIGNKAMTFLLPFSTTYLCEQGFWALTVVKTKARNCLSPGNNLRVALSKIEPCIEEIMKRKYQFHQSYWTNDLFLINCCVKILFTMTGCLIADWQSANIKKHFFYV